MTDTERVRVALNTTDDTDAWDAFNRILSEIDKLRETVRLQESMLDDRESLAEKLNAAEVEIERLREELAQARKWNVSWAERRCELCGDKLMSDYTRICYTCQHKESSDDQG